MESGERRAIERGDGVGESEEEGKEEEGKGVMVFIVKWGRGKEGKRVRVEVGGGNNVRRMII